MQFYVDHGPAILPSTGIGSRLGWFRQIFRPKHSRAVLAAKLGEILGGSRFDPDFDFALGDTAAVDVALATSAAPTYWSAPAAKTRRLPSLRARAAA